MTGEPTFPGLVMLNVSVKQSPMPDPVLMTAVATVVPSWGLAMVKD